MHCTGRIFVNSQVDLYLKLGRPDNYVEDLPPIIFIHGNDVDHTVWRCQEKFFLEQGYQTVSYDLRGFGLSSKPGGSLAPSVHAQDLHVLIQKLDFKQVILVGWSTGGMVAQEYALKYPQTLNYLVLVNSTPSAQSTEIFPYKYTDLSEDFNEYIVQEVQAIIPEHFTSDSSNRLRDYLASLIRQTGKHIAFKHRRDLATFNTIEQLQDLTVPTLIIFGSQDQMVDPGASLFMRANMPTAHILEFPETGHAPFLTCKDKFNQAVLRLISEDSLKCENICTELSECAPQ